MLQNIIRKIENFFELNKNIDLKESRIQKGMNLLVSFSNKSYLYLFDKSDESLINDYEEILNDEGDIIENFSSLLDGFIEKNPENFEEEINDEWHEKSTSNKLVFESPIPLNDEQKKVLIALQKKDCNFMILEGPPGTGKSHTITAIICKALLEEKSVLVLSDKKEALDVVESKISETWNKVRHEDDFQNPILRLGKTGNKFYKIVQGQTINKIKEHYNAYKFKKDEYDNNRKTVLKKLEKNISENINYFNNINIDDIKFYFKNFDKLSKINWFSSFEESKLDLLKIKKVLNKLSKNNDSFKVDIDVLSNKNYKLITEYRNLLVNLQSSKESFQQSNTKINVDELIKIFDERDPYKQLILDNLITIQNTSAQLKNICEDNDLISNVFENKEELNIKNLLWRQNILDTSLNLFVEANKFFMKDFSGYKLLSNFEIPNDKNIDAAIGDLQKYSQELNNLRKPIINYLFKDSKIEDLTRELKKTFNYFSIEKPQKHAKDIQYIADLFKFLHDKMSDKNLKELDDEQRVIKLLIDYLLHYENDQYILIFSEIQKQQKLLLESKLRVERLEPSLKDTSNLDRDIKIITWNIEVFKEIHKINGITKKLFKIVPNEFLFTESPKCSSYFNVKKIKHINDYINNIEKLIEFKEDINFVIDIDKNYKDFSKNIKLNISTDKVNESSSILADFSDEEIKEYIQFNKLEEKLEDVFNNQPQDVYSDAAVELEDLTTARMTHFLDKRIIEYTRNFASEVGTLKNIISRKEKFPKALFKNLEKAFPCMLAGIRDYAEFIPLEKNLLIRRRFKRS